MTRFLVVCLGGAIGTGARYLVGLGAQLLLGGTFPFGTLTVNLLGSFLIAVVMVLGIDKGAIGPDVRIFLTTGVMGGFTTYSSFNFETTRFLQQGAVGLALLNVAGTLFGCLVAGALGVVVGRLIGGA